MDFPGVGTGSILRIISILRRCEPDKGIKKGERKNDKD